MLDIVSIEKIGTIFAFILRLMHLSMKRRVLSLRSASPRNEAQFLPYHRPSAIYRAFFQVKFHKSYYAICYNIT